MKQHQKHQNHKILDSMCPVCKLWFPSDKAWKIHRRNKHFRQRLKKWTKNQKKNPQIII